MYKWRQNVKIYLYAMVFMAAYVLTGCGGNKREEFPLASWQPEKKAADRNGIVIEIVNDRDSETLSEDEEEEAAGKEEQDRRQENNQEESASGEQENNGFDELIPEEVYPGEILNKEDVQAAGEDCFFTSQRISDDVFDRMYGNSYKEGCPVGREDLRYLKILHYDFSGNIRAGELVCHKSVSEDMSRIFRQLYEAEYPIEKVVLIDDYGGDDDLSSEDNNTSCFNYRTVAGSQSLSLHALGVAIDINPLYNPYITWNSQGEPECAPSGGAAYMDRSQDFPYKIDEQDLCCRLFTQAGFSWGGSWSGHKDYMHFSRGAAPER